MWSGCVSRPTSGTTVGRSSTSCLLFCLQQSTTAVSQTINETDCIKLVLLMKFMVIIYMKFLVLGCFWEKCTLHLLKQKLSLILTWWNVILRNDYNLCIKIHVYLCGLICLQSLILLEAPGANALKICRMDKYGGCCTGNEEVFLLCEKVQKGETYKETLLIDDQVPISNN